MLLQQTTGWGSSSLHFIQKWTNRSREQHYTLEEYKIYALKHSIWPLSLADLVAETAWFYQPSPYPALPECRGNVSSGSWTWCSGDSSLFSQHAHLNDEPCSESLSLPWFHVASKLISICIKPFMYFINNNINFLHWAFIFKIQKSNTYFRHQKRKGKNYFHMLPVVHFIDRVANRYIVHVVKVSSQYLQ